MVGYFQSLIKQLVLSGVQSDNIPHGQNEGLHVALSQAPSSFSERSPRQKLECQMLCIISKDTNLISCIMAIVLPQNDHEV